MSNETVPVRRMTKQRRLIWEELDHNHDFRSAQQIHADLTADEKKIGLATVYRTLQTMADEHEVDVVRNPEGENLYRRCSSGHHHHLICRDCGKAEEIQVNKFEEWVDEVSAEHGFSNPEHLVEIYATCDECTKAN